MIFRQLSLRRQVSVIGIAISVAIALSVPLLEAVRIHGEQQRAVVVRARNIAHALAGQATDEGRLQTERLRLSEIIRPKDVGGGQSHRVLDMDGAVLVEGGRARRWPVLRARAPIQVRGETVGVVEVVAGLRPFLRQIGFAAVAGILLGLAAFFAACVLPLRIVDRKLRAMALVMAQQASTRAVLPSEALATLGREIRRPVRSAAGTASLLLATELSPEQRRHVE
ncbi:MAG TPA: hypothetical protein VHN20_09195, partial [Beijerinckiaceae bacterium]|nr:hypothetical protein [Beijerinckiaceae bacterium]